jgi:signal recognition particle GTPase
MILWWGKKKPVDPKTGETPIEPLKPREQPASGLKPTASLDEQIFGRPEERLAPAPLTDEEDTLGIRKVAERIAAERAAAEAARQQSVLFKLNEGLKRSSSRLAEGLGSVFTGRRITRETLEELEDLLITSDMGSKVAKRLAAEVSKGRFDREVGEGEIKAALAEGVAAILKPREKLVDFSDGPKPRIVLFVGVNGSGKTTTIGKIAAKLSAQGADIVLAAGDTFRAAAVEQLKVWSERANARFISKPAGADAAGLAYEAVEIARSENRDLVLIDTVGMGQRDGRLTAQLQMLTSPSIEPVLFLNASAQGETLDDVVRTRIYLRQAEDIEAVGRAHREAFTNARPATTGVVTGLLAARWHVEIEAEAVVGGDGTA